MSGGSRRASRRENPDTFGLSTLDTVTCALGGSIVLMLLLASLTDPQAEVTLDARRQILQSGSGEIAKSWAAGSREPGDPERNASTSLVLLIVDYEDAVPGTFETAGCGGAIRITELRHSNDTFSKNGASRIRAVTIWRDGPAKTKCGAFAVDLPMQGDLSRGCTMTLVSGAHYQYREESECPKKVDLTSNEGEVFRFKRGF